ncbi:hypothetical protein E4H12_05025 [Candidatus Thorarchaeota archaeon]|jgi:hypothetical protein|nr:MAG: hypothetical protein E4H12_05025 [Candidatus Thorarchaeota archaeon]
MTEEKWKIVGGSVYRLAKVFGEMIEAVTHAKELKEKHHVFLSKTQDGLWAVYWRSKEPTIEYEPKYYSV